MDRNLRVLGIGSGLRSFGLTFVGPYAALYLFRVAGLGYLLIGLLLAAISIPPLLWSPWAGALADRFGRRRLFVLALFGEAGAIGVVALSIDRGSLVGFIGGFALLGLLGTTGGPALSAYVADVAHGSDRTMGFTWLRVGTNIGFAIGVAAGGFVVGAFGFLASAIASGLFLAIGAALVATWLEPSPYDRGLRPRAPAVATARATERGWLRQVVGDRLFLLTAASFALAVLVTAQWGTTYALFAGNELGLPYAAIGAGFALNGIIVVAGQASTTQAVLGRRHTTIGIYGTLCYVAGFLVLGVIPRVGADVFVLFLGATAIITLGENLITIPMSTLPSNLAPGESIGAYNGAFGTIQGIGGLLATVVGGAALALLPDPTVLWLVLSAPALPACLLLRWVGGRLPERPNRA